MIMWCICATEGFGSGQKLLEIRLESACSLLIDNSLVRDALLNDSMVLIRDRVYDLRTISLWLPLRLSQGTLHTHLYRGCLDPQAARPGEHATGTMTASADWTRRFSHSHLPTDKSLSHPKMPKATWAGQQRCSSSFSFTHEAPCNKRTPLESVVHAFPTYGWLAGLFLWAWGPFPHSAWDSRGLRSCLVAFSSATWDKDKVSIDTLGCDSRIHNHNEVLARKDYTVRNRDFLAEIAIVFERGVSSHVQRLWNTEYHTNFWILNPKDWFPKVFSAPQWFNSDFELHLQLLVICKFRSCRDVGHSTWSFTDWVPGNDRLCSRVVSLSMQCTLEVIRRECLSRALMFFLASLAFHDLHHLSMSAADVPTSEQVIEVW